jgi:hypothetical protein
MHRLAARCRIDTLYSVEVIFLDSPISSGAFHQLVWRVWD